MAEAEVDVRNPSGLHARPAATFVRAAGGFACDIRVANLNRDPARLTNAKSILGVMGLAVARGHRIRIQADGEGAESAISHLVELIDGGLGEQIT